MMGENDMASSYFYREEVEHVGLGKYKVIKAQTSYELEQKVKAQKAQWNEQWAKKVERERRIQNDIDSLKYANELTLDAEKVQNSIDNLLLESLAPIKLNFDELKDRKKYEIPRPKQPEINFRPSEPQRTSASYNQKPSLFVRLSKKKMEEFIKESDMKFEEDYKKWEVRVKEFEENHEKNMKIFKEKLEQWQIENDKFYEKQAIQNKEIDGFKDDFKEGISYAVEKYYKLLLEKVKFPFEFENSVELEYQSDNKNLIVDMLLPCKEELPTLKSVSYIKSKKDFKKTHFTENQMKKKYDSFIYQMVLQTINYVYTSTPELNLINSIVINGRINTIDKATGKAIEPYILSINVNKEAFEDINLSAVDAKVWFKSAKGVSAASFANVTPVAPIVQMKKEDSRFVEGYAVAETIDDSMNLASMDWKDFENLIREIFEQEFNSTGGHVKITQASRDGGVDAVAFDPDPIRGGKIIIQAKRYTNVVGVSAVRDLYGTILNEGANKGILVTTSNYGNDAYKFANGKPITLMNGANLLYLMEKHGHKARIDLREAKRYFAEQK